MTASLPPLLMVLATRCLGDRRREWALAMEAEFEAAVEDGRPLAFAVGCLAASLREMPARAEGRYALASHAVAVCLIVPMAALLLLGVCVGFPYLSPGQAGLYGLLSGGGPELAPNDAHWSAVPSLAGLVLLLGVGHLPLAWFLLDRDWGRVAVMGRLNAAVAATLVCFMAVLFLDDLRALVQAAALAAELAIVAGLARWHERLALHA